MDAVLPLQEVLGVPKIKGRFIETICSSAFVHLLKHTDLSPRMLQHKPTGAEKIGKAWIIGLLLP